MREVVLRPALARFAAALLLGTSALPALAQDLPAPAGGSGPARPPHAGRSDATLDGRLAIPPLPRAEVRVLAGDPRPRSAPGLQPKAERAGPAPAVPPALSFDEGSPVLRREALLTDQPGARDTSSRPGTAVPEARPAPSSTLDAAAMAAALPAFVTAGVPGDTPAQAADRRRDREAIAAYYAAHDNAPLWIAEGRLTPVARAALARIDHAAEDALDLSRFAVSAPKTTDPAALAEADLALSEAVVAYGRQASGSRVDVARIGGLIDFRPDVADAGRILSAVSTAAEPGDSLRGFNPQLPGYRALREKLAELRQASPADAQVRIPAGPVLKPGMKDPRVPLIRARFGLDVGGVQPGEPPLVYDTKVAAAVAMFQRTHGLPASGLLNARTVAALSGGNPTKLENTIIANMELWRWMPRELAADRVEVNIPDYNARVIRDGSVVHQTRVVVGQPDKPTPVFAEQMRFIIVNPYWNVPLSIIRHEMMPKLASDPNYFADHGYEVVERDGVRYVRQPPGEGNALGRIKFMFPNSHAVYLHDTNARSYFGRDMRALSHGCVRVDQPFSFAEAVLGRENGWSEARVRKMIGGQERTIAMPKPLPILITYFTAFVDPDQGFQLREDVYGYAGRVKLALNLQD